MRVAIVSPYALDVVGGVQSHVLSLAAALGRAGEEVVVLGPSAGGTLEDRTADGVPIVDIGRTVPIPVNGSRAPVALGPSSALRVQEVIRRAVPDVVHVHEPIVPVVGPAAVLATGAMKVVTFHATAEGGMLPRLYRAVRAPARRIVETAGALTAVSAVAAAFHARVLGIDPSRIAIVPNGVAVRRFARCVDARTGGRDSVRLVFLGRLERRKGVDIAVRAFLHLAPERPELRLRVLGDGPLADELRRLVEAAPPEVASRVELVGRADPDALPGMLSDADVALLPARGGESFGIVLLEAMAAGLPIVATDIPGYRAVARHAREALLVPPDDPGALARATARLLEDGALAARLVRAGARRAAAHDWSLVAAQMRTIYGGGPEGPGSP